MANKKIWLGMLVLVLTFGMTAIGCGGGGADDPIKVDLKLPAIQSVPSFEGNFVSNENEAKDLIGDAIDALADLSDLSFSASMVAQIASPRSISRKVQTEPFQEVYERKKIADGAYLTGFEDGYWKESVAKENSFSAGDYMESSMRAKVALEFENYKKAGCTFNGKYFYDEDMFFKEEIVSLSPEKIKATIRLNANNGYSLSVSKNGKGLKFVIELKAKVNKTLTDADEEDLFENFYDLFDTFNITIDVYDNANVKTYSKSFKTFEDAEDYIGSSIIGF